MAPVLFISSLAILIMLVVLTYYLRSARVYREHETEMQDDEDAPLLSIFSSQNLVFTAIIIAILLMIFSVYLMVRGTLWEGHLMEWLNIIVRLMHITFGIAWIGASFYFVFLENALNRTRDIRDELAGNLWAIHGGGFYYLEKYKIAPAKIPKHLHWFKYEAYFTWLSGFSLLFIVYYFNAASTLVDKNVLDITSGTAVAIGIGSLLLGWIVYDLLCKSPLAKSPLAFGLTGFVMAFLFAFGYTHIFPAKAAFMHFGAMLGTIMAANVFMVIIPSQKAMVRAARQGLQLDATLGKNAGRRSLHNNYLTLPVLFVMISNHFPVTYGNARPWLILMIITVGTAGVKHYLNVKEKGQLSVWVLPASVILLLSAAFLTAPEKKMESCSSAVSIDDVNAIVQKRCVSCHSTKPTDDFYTAPPNGIVYETPADIVRLKDRILQRAVLTKTMPLNNKTNMTEAERGKIRCWIEQMK